MFNLTNKKVIDEKADEKPGIYRIYWIKENNPQTIERICKKDTSGLLYIGKTEGTLQNRLNQFRCSAFKGSTNHSGALKYRKSNALRKLIKENELFAIIEPCNNATDKEKKELRNYIDQFGEVPPLNG